MSSIGTKLFYICACMVFILQIALIQISNAQMAYVWTITIGVMDPMIAEITQMK